MLQVTAPPATAAQLLWLLAPGDVPALPRARHSLRQAVDLLLHQEDVPAVPAVAITVGGAGRLSRHPPCFWFLGSSAVASASCLTPRAASRHQHQHGFPLPRPTRWRTHSCPVPRTHSCEPYWIVVPARSQPRDAGHEPGRVAGRTLPGLAAHQARGEGRAARGAHLRAPHGGPGRRLRHPAPHAHRRALSAAVLKRLHGLLEPDRISSRSCGVTWSDGYAAAYWTPLCVAMFFLELELRFDYARHNLC